ncbi:MAG: hypothetical protein K0R99_1989 [Microbacterium sp.]|jgi:hypothetical protein|nr:hypothetical protein [Microbacterium sp.]MDF2560543.1 hypothetical protein [Microbacterium sp.]
MNEKREGEFAFEEIEGVDAPSADTFWWGMWSGVTVVAAAVALT